MLNFKKSCCCSKESLKYIDCAFDKVFPANYDLSGEHCKSACGGAAAGSSLKLLAILLVIPLGLFFLYRRRNLKEVRFEWFFYTFCFFSSFDKILDVYALTQNLGTSLLFLLQTSLYCGSRYSFRPTNILAFDVGDQTSRKLSPPVTVHEEWSDEDGLQYARDGVHAPRSILARTLARFKRYNTVTVDDHHENYDLSRFQELFPGYHDLSASFSELFPGGQKQSATPSKAVVDHPWEGVDKLSSPSKEAVGQTSQSRGQALLHDPWHDSHELVLTLNDGESGTVADQMEAQKNAFNSLSGMNFADRQRKKDLLERNERSNREEIEETHNDLKELFNSSFLLREEQLEQEAEKIKKQPKKAWRNDLDISRSHHSTLDFVESSGSKFDKRGLRRELRRCKSSESRFDLAKSTHHDKKSASPRAPRGRGMSRHKSAGNVLEQMRAATKKNVAPPPKPPNGRGIGFDEESSSIDDDCTLDSFAEDYADSTSSSSESESSSSFEESLDLEDIELDTIKPVPPPPPPPRQFGSSFFRQMSSSQDAERKLPTRSKSADGFGLVGITLRFDMPGSKKSPKENKEDKTAEGKEKKKNGKKKKRNDPSTAPTVPKRRHSFDGIGVEKSIKKTKKKKKSKEGKSKEKGSAKRNKLKSPQKELKSPKTELKSPKSKIKAPGTPKKTMTKSNSGELTFRSPRQGVARSKSSDGFPSSLKSKSSRLL